MPAKGETSDAIYRKIETSTACLFLTLKFIGSVALIQTESINQTKMAPLWPVMDKAGPMESSPWRFASPSVPAITVSFFLIKYL